MVNEEYEAVREAVRALAEKEIAPYAAEVDELERFPHEAQTALTSSGFHAVHIPEAYGGQGADAVATCIVIEEVARVCASSSLIPAVNKLATTGLLLAGSEQLRQQVLPAVAAGSIACYALSEREAGSDAAAMRTRARFDGNHWVLNGTKCWISNAGQASWYTVMAVTDPEQGAKGISAFAVHKDDPGFSVGPKERKLGIRGAPTREIYFEDCTIPEDRIIGDPGTGFKTALATLEHTRPTIGAQAVGIAQGAVDAAIAYVKQRKQFGKPIGAFQAVKHHLAEVAVAIEFAEPVVHRAAYALARGEAHASIHVSHARLAAGEAAWLAARKSLQVHGAMGYTWEADLQMFMKRAWALDATWGDRAFHKTRIAECLLAEGAALGPGQTFDPGAPRTVEPQRRLAHA